MKNTFSPLLDQNTRIMSIKLNNSIASQHSNPCSTDPDQCPGLCCKTPKGDLECCQEVAYRCCEDGSCVPPYAFCD